MSRTTTLGLAACLPTFQRPSLLSRSQTSAYACLALVPMFRKADSALIKMASADLGKWLSLAQYALHALGIVVCMF